MTKITSPDWRISTLLIFVLYDDHVDFDAIAGLKKSLKVGAWRECSGFIGAQKEAVSMVCRSRARLVHFR